MGNTQARSTMSAAIDGQPHSAGSASVYSRAIPSQVTVVKSGLEQEARRGSFVPEDLLKLPPLVKPLIPVGHEFPGYSQSGAHVLDSTSVLHLGQVIQELIRSRADASLRIQDSLTHKIKLIGHMSLSNFNTNASKQTQFAELYSNSSKIQDMLTLVDRTLEVIPSLVNKLNELNLLLPENERLDPLEIEPRQSYTE